MALGTLVKVAAIAALAVWFFRGGQGTLSALLDRPAKAEAPVGIDEQVSRSPVSSFSCTGKTRCTEMTSCEEAIFYINNCPNTKMDGNNDGVPCESQWCGR